VRLTISWRTSGKLAGLLLVLAVLVLLPLVIRSPYLIHLLIMTFIGVVLGMTFSMLFSTGLITLGAAAFYAIGAYTSALLTLNAGLSFWLALPLATLMAGVIALLLGSIIVRNPGVAFVVITFIFNAVVVEAAGGLRQLGGWGGILGIPRPDPIPLPFYGPVEFITKTPYYYLMLALLLLIMLVFYALYNSRIGRAWRAIKLSPALAETLGINLYRYRLLAFVIASSAAGVAGSFYAHYFQSIIPEAFGGWTSIYIQLYSVLGGLDFYLLGPAIGAAIMTFLPEFLRVAKEIEPLITGALLVMIILFFPGGILGTLRQFPRLGPASLSARLGEIKNWLLSGRNLR